ncbi:MAG: twin-arginine translocation signal domain-containing protein [Acidobacteriota bacterium]
MDRRRFMKLLTMLTAAVLTAGLWGSGAKAQMKDGSAEMGMMKQHEETTKLVDQLAKSFAAIEAEKNPAELQKKIAAHGVVLKELQAVTQGHGKMMDEMKAKMATKMGTVAPPAAQEKKPVPEDHSAHH